MPTNTSTNTLTNTSTNEAQLRVCTYNIHKGFSTGRRRFLLDDIRSAIRAVDADVVCLQEVMGEDLGNNRESNQFEYLADTIWPHSAYGHNAIYDSGHHGNAILSKHGFLSFENIDVSQWSFSQRGLLFGKTELGVYLVCVHFGLFERERGRQLDALERLLSERVPEGAPLIVAGDFNDWRRVIDRSIRARLGLEEAYSELFGAPARTFPGKWPLLPMDRIYFRGLRLLQAEVLTGMPWRRLSDHCALTATFAV